MTHAGVDHLGASGCGPVALAVAIGAEERAALDHLARNAELRLARDRSSPRRRRHGGCAARSTACRRRQSDVLDVPVGRSTPTRCRPCRRDRIRSAGTTRPARWRRTRRPRRCATGSRPARSWRGTARRDRGSSPHMKGALARRRGPPTPTRPRSAAPRPSRRRRPRRPRTRRGRRDGRHDRRASNARPSGCRHDAPGVHVHHWLRWRRSTGPGVGVNTIEPAHEILGRRTREVVRIEWSLGHRHVAGGARRTRRMGVGHGRAG